MPRQSLAAAKSKAAKLSKLDSLGSTKSDFFTEDSLNAVDKIVGNFITKVKANIEKAGLVVSGKIEDITMEKKPNGIDVMAYPELIYQDKGVNGTENKSRNSGKGFTDKRPPVAPIQEWVDKRGIKANAYAIRETIYKQGIKAKNVYSNELPKLIDEIAKGVLDFTVNEFFKTF